MTYQVIFIVKKKIIDIAFFLTIGTWLMYSRWRFKKSHVHFVYFYNYLLCFTTHLKMQYHGDKGDKDLKKHESMTEKSPR